MFLIVIYLSVSRSVMPASLRPHGLQPTRLLCPWDFPGKHTGVGCYFLLQGILTQGSDHISCLAGGFFTAEPPGKKPPYPTADLQMTALSCWDNSSLWSFCHLYPLVYFRFALIFKDHCKTGQLNSFIILLFRKVWLLSLPPPSVFLLGSCFLVISQSSFF